MAVSKRRKLKKTTGHARHRSTLPSASLLSSIPKEGSSGWIFKRWRSTGANGSAELNISAFFFVLLIAILVLFLTVAVLGAYYFSQQSMNDHKSHSPLRNNSLILTNQAAQYRANQNINAKLNNTNRKSSCTSINTSSECQDRPDCTIEYICDCDTAVMRSDKCDYDLLPNEACICGQSGFNRCIELVCPIDR